MKKKSFYSDMQTFVAVTTIGTSSLRNQGSKGVIKSARQYLASLEIESFCTNSEINYLSVLNRETERLRRSLPKGAQNWGAARKALNLFMRHVFYNKFLHDKYRLCRFENWMEIPLDSLIARSLKRNGVRGHLPGWPGLSKLTPEISSKFQDHAKIIANSKGISRVHLDMHLWTKERDK